MVWKAVTDFLTDPKMAKELLEIAKEQSDGWNGKAEAEKLQRKIKSIDDQGVALAERVSQLPKNLDPKTLFDQMARLQQAKAETQSALNDVLLELEKRPEPASFDDYKKFAEQLRALLKTEDPVIKFFVIETVIQKIMVTINGIIIHFRVGQEHYQKEFEQTLIQEQTSLQTPKNIKLGAVGSNKKPSQENFKVMCSNSLQIGAG